MSILIRLPLRSLRVLLLGALLLLFVSACPERNRGNDDDSGSDDDDTAVDDDDTVDDDDSAADDDDTSTDDDDSGDDDDDSAIGDDDDATEPWTPFMNRVYCIDWTLVTIESPPGLASLLLLAGADLNDYPVLLEPIAVDTTQNTIDFLAGFGSTASCAQNLTRPTAFVPDAGGGTSTYVQPDFLASTTFFTLPIGEPPPIIYDMTLQGSFSADAASIINSQLSGQLDVTAFEDTACNLDTWTCYPCGPAGDRACVDLLVTDGVWTDNGLGVSLQVVP